LGVVGFASQFPSFLLAPVAGVCVDRWDRHRLLIVTQVLSMIQSFALAALTLTGLINVPIIKDVLHYFVNVDYDRHMSLIAEIKENNKKKLGVVIFVVALLIAGAMLPSRFALQHAQAASCTAAFTAK